MQAKNIHMVQNSAIKYKKFAKLKKTKPLSKAEMSKNGLKAKWYLISNP